MMISCLGPTLAKPSLGQLSWRKTFDFCLFSWSSSRCSLWIINAVGSGLTGKAPPK